MTIRTLLVALLVLLFGANVAICSEARIALVIGNGAYQVGPLERTIADSRTVADALETVGFAVEHLADANREEMDRAIERFARQLSHDDVGFFYFAGHGSQLGVSDSPERNNYLLPVKADVLSELDLESRAFDIGLLLKRLKRAGNKANIVVLDACRDNPWKSSFKSVARGLARVAPEASQGTLIAYSTGPGELAPDDSSYAEALAGVIRSKPYSFVDALFKAVGNRVRQVSNGVQRPWYVSSLSAPGPTLTPIEAAILAPDAGSTVSPEFLASGNASTPPEGHHLWLAVEKGRLIWAKEPEIQVIDGEWTNIVNEGGPPSPFYLSLYLVDEESHRRILRWFEDGLKTNRWPGLDAREVGERLARTPLRLGGVNRFTAGLSAILPAGSSDSALQSWSPSPPGLPKAAERPR